MTERPKSGLCTAGLVMGILCAVFAFLPFGNLIFGLLGFIFSVVSLGRKRGSVAKGVWGLVLSVVGVLIKIAAVIVLLIVVGIGTIVALIGTGLTALGLGKLAGSLNEWSNENNLGDSASNWLLEELLGEDYSDWYDEYGDWDYDYDDLDYSGDGYGWDDDSAFDWDYSGDGYDWGDDITADQGNYKDDEWTWNYLPSGDAYTIEGVLFNVPQGFYFDYEDKETKEVCYWYGNDYVDFPNVVKNYDTSLSTDEAYEDLMNSNFFNGFTVLSADTETHYWNEDWDIAYVEAEENDKGVYFYVILAFSKRSDNVVCFSYRPYECKLTEDCYDLQYLVNYITYIGE